MATKANTNKQHKTASDNKTRQTPRGNFDFTGFPQNFTNPAQFFNFATLPGLRPANLQSLLQQVVATNQKNMEALTACTQMYVDRAKDVFAQHATLGSELFHETANTWQESLNGAQSDPRAKLADMGEFVKYCLDRSTTAARKTTEETMQVCKEMTDQWNKRMNAAVDEMRTAA